jgi:hypothetical protein
VGDDGGQHLPGLAGGQHVQAHRGGDVVPAGGAAACDHEPPGRHLGEQGLDVGRVGDVVQHDQPTAVTGQPGQRAVSQGRDRQQLGQTRLKSVGKRRQPRVDRGRGVGGDPPDHVEVCPVGDGVPGGEGALADPAEPVYRLDGCIPAIRQRLLQALQIRGPAHEQARQLRQVHQPRRVTDEVIVLRIMLADLHALTRRYIHSSRPTTAAHPGTPQPSPDATHPPNAASAAPTPSAADHREFPDGSRRAKISAPLTQDASTKAARLTMPAAHHRNRLRPATMTHP